MPSSTHFGRRLLLITRADIFVNDRSDFLSYDRMQEIELIKSSPEHIKLPKACSASFPRAQRASLIAGLCPELPSGLWKGSYRSGRWPHPCRGRWRTTIVSWLYQPDSFYPNHARLLFLCLWDASLLTQSRILYLSHQVDLFAVQLEESEKAWSSLAYLDYYSSVLTDWYPFNLSLFKSSLEASAPQHRRDSGRPSTSD